MGILQQAGMVARFGNLIRVDFKVIILGVIHANI